MCEEGNRDSCEKLVPGEVAGRGVGTSHWSRRSESPARQFSVVDVRTGNDLSFKVLLIDLFPVVRPFQHQWLEAAQRSSHRSVRNIASSDYCEG